MKILLEQAQSLIDAVFWGSAKTPTHVRLRAYLFLTLFVIGIIYWIGFFSSGNLSLSANDWVKEDAYLNTLRFAQTNSTIPWQWSESFYHNTDKFLANPEIILTPDIILLPWVSNGVFIIIHVALFYAAGFWGSFLLAKKLNVSFLSFFFFWLLFNFNGHISAQIAMGHFQWAGYFLIPFFFIFLFKFTENHQDRSSFNKSPVLGISLLFGILFLNGSVHIAIICALFLIVTLLFKWTLYPNIISSIFIGFTLGLNRLLPAALWFPSKDIFGQGYPTVIYLFDAFTALRAYSFTDFREYRVWGWWEYDFYIGFVSLIIFIISIAVIFRRGKVAFPSYLLKAAGIFLLLSLGNVYNIFNKLHLPLIGIERVPSRFLIMPFTFFLILSMIGIDELANSSEKWVKTLLVSAMPFAMGELFFHFEFWRVQIIELYSEKIEKPMLLLMPCSDQVYITTVYASWIASGMALILVIWFLLKKRTKTIG